MSSSPSPAWIFHYSPKPDLAISSTLSFPLKETIRRTITRRISLPHCSSLPEVPEVPEVDPTIPSFSTRKKNINGYYGGEDEEERKPKDSDLALQATFKKVKRRRGGPLLWKRIFFASKKVRRVILLNVITVIYASDIPVLKEVEQITDPAFFTMVRFAVTAIPFLPFVLTAPKDNQTRSAGIELGFWVSLGYLCQAVGLVTSEAGQASFISAFTVIVVPLIDGMFGATVPALTWTGALASLVGVGILESAGSPPCVGDILNIMSAVFFGVHMLRTEQISRNTKKEHFLALLGYQVCVVAFSSVIWFLFKGIISSEVHQLSSGSWEWSMLYDWMIQFPWVPALYTGVFSTGLCLWAELDAMRDISATETAIIYGLEPVWGAAFAWFLLGERWGTTQWIGAALVLCGSLTVQILGGSPSEEFSKKGDPSSNCHLSNTSNKQKDVALSTVVVKSRETSELFRKQDKL